MTRGLYRVYLYTVTILLAAAITGTLGYLLGELFGLTPLRGSSELSSTRDLTQSAILFGVTLLVAGGFGALHYWLIRRDSAGDSATSESGARTFLLNFAEAIAILVAVTFAVNSLGQIGANYSPDIAGPLAYGLAVFGLALAIEWERRRLTPTRGAALVFERLRRHGVPLILLSMLLSTLYITVANLERAISQQANLFACRTPTSQNFGLPDCVGNELIGESLAAAVVVGVWLWFLWLGRRDAQSLVRQVMLLLGWSIGGMIFLVIALQRVAEYVLRLLTPAAGTPNYLNQFDFAPLAVVAVVELAVYGWMLRERADPAMDTPATRLTMRALAGLTLAAPFWIGIFLVLRQFFNLVAPGAQVPSAGDWDVAAAYLIAGASYIPLAFWLGADTRAWEIRGPRRGFVLGLLAAGALATAGGAATLLFAVVTPLLNVPLDNWQDVARTAGAVLITGAALGGLYLYIALREKQFTGAPSAPEAVPVASPTEAAEPAPVGANGATSPSLDEVLAQFKGGDLSQDAAAARIRDLARAGALV
jgi:hypothetical protein